MSFAPARAFEVRLDGFEGPLDLLLELARAQKVDLAKISIVALADQYLDWLERAKEARLAVAAEYLVMAAWLAYLKSQLLLPPAERAAPDPVEEANALAARLARLDAIRAAVGWLEARPRLGRERLPRGRFEPLPVEVRPRWVASLAELLAAGARLAARGAPDRLRLERPRLLTVETMIERLALRLSGMEWRELASFLPPGLTSGLERRAAVAAGLLAGLELARQGAIELEQPVPFGPILIRRRA
ncbi:MAG: segregation/condensation protein A [Geminicoccaceae bacterium]|nr:segregation/condensation protein A [Geminicoccaceae bacterium]MCX8101669.1 segregation/condensation protein A [Geminicoccaceae bacterium]MDW8371453.1 ScpA family protein [Geminicoccaceae bacterium]